MSKDKPEAGDVWEWNGNRIFITCVLGDEKIGAISFMNNSDRHHCTDGFDAFDEKIRYGVMKYIGPSKVNIDNLFQTAAEGEIKNNPTLQTLKGKVNFLINEIGELSARGAFSYTDDCALKKLCQKIKELMGRL